MARLFRIVTFRRLLIDDSELGFFSEATKGEKVVRLSYIRYLCLRIELRNYNYPQCDEVESRDTKKWNNQIFTHSLKKLFQVLCRWKPLDNRDTGLIFEITAYSPGDIDCCPEASMEYDLHSKFQLEGDLTSQPSITEFMDTKEFRGMLMLGKNWHRPRTMERLQRLRGTTLKLSTKENPKPAPIVHTLWIRHQFHRGVGPRSLARLLCKTLVNVASLRLEVLSSLEEPQFQGQYDASEDIYPENPPNWNEFILVLPRHIQHFSFNLFSRTQTGSEYLRTKECLGEPRIGNRSKLTQLCLQIGGDFSEDVLRFHQNDINRAVKISAVTVRSLPKFQILELWGCDGINTFMFRYELVKDHVTITWRATEDWITLEGENIQEWAKVAEGYNVGFSAKKEPFLRVTRGGMHIDGKIIYRHMKLCDLAMNPVTWLTLRQGEPGRADGRTKGSG
ncbi:uncharacterized protein BKA55DRAFT_542643 [Fusarium redolens]|uniref:DUF6546 domain-containing protein n=1 Tax=Fusarium redolens TaxID=48865 RepID=A0A9P9GJ46_FUSRE|nr:uncharacterized protein BKA55DRAFT_542643 [Fusarium redolens]KAH7240046.1 hypothetical protein BKA55DRAFT_542643 [Fusarium redolens]